MLSALKAFRLAQVALVVQPTMALPLPVVGLAAY
jgi:hypothetical protein